ncbi:transport-associated protein [Caballeronia temeraria]|uniref:Transport-associated protein n=1 Tax=Caballeronia temeraria TaxID=1777137 RepID=A0A158CGP4_9BURK|nr:BON domain-containing protein [Caballeronia temeraria]SAK81440.1 transport-associated protein [Caballeronia temeraria]
MKTINALRFTAVASAIAFSVNVWAQTSDAGATQSATPSASAGSSKSAMRKANRALSKKVSQALQKGGVELNGINVIAKNGAITLAGHAADAEQIDKAASIAKGVDGVKSVKNVLTIQEGGQ